MIYDTYKGEIVITHPKKKKNACWKNARFSWWFIFSL